MTSALRPMSLGEILDRTIQIYRSRFLVFVSIWAIAATVMMTVNFADTIWSMRRLLPHPSPVAAWLLTILDWLAVSHLHSLIGSVFAPALVRQTRCSVFDSQESVRESLSFGLRRWRRFLGIATLKLALGPLAAEIASVVVLCGLAVLTYLIDPKMRAPSIVFMVVVVALSGLILAQWLSACFSLSIPAATLEDLGGMAVLQRSWRVTRERRWAIQFIWIGLFLGHLVVLYTLAFLLRWGWTLVLRAWHFHFSRPWYEASFFPVYIAVGALVGPIFAIASTLIYYDQRIRNEGYDIERMMDAAGMSAPAAPAVVVAGDSAEAEVQPG